MAKPSTLSPLLLLVLVLKHLVATTHAFVVHPATSSSRHPYSTAPIYVRLEMSGDKEIEVVSKPDEVFLAKKGCVVHPSCRFAMKRVLTHAFPRGYIYFRNIPPL